MSRQFFDGSEAIGQGMKGIRIEPLDATDKHMSQCDVNAERPKLQSEISA